MNSSLFHERIAPLSIASPTLPIKIALGGNNFCAGVDSQVHLPKIESYI